MTRDELRDRYRSLNAAEWRAGDEVIETFESGGSFGEVVQKLRILRDRRARLIRDAHEGVVREVAN